MMKSAKKWLRQNATNGMYCSPRRRVLVDRKVRASRVIQQRLRTPTGPFFARFFIGIILGLVAEFCVHKAVDKADDVVFRSTLDGSQADRWLEVPAWMFDRMACADAEPLTAQPFVSIDALAALSALLDLALKNRTPSVALLSGASRASHDENRGETHVTRDGNARERIPTQSTTAAAADGSVRERSVERRHRRARMAGAAGGSAGGAHEPDDAVDPRPCCDDRDAAREGG